MKVPALIIVIIFFVAYVLIVGWLILARMVEKWKEKRYEKSIAKLKTKIKVMRVTDRNAAMIVYLFHEIKREYDVDPERTDKLYDEFLAKFKPVLHARIAKQIAENL